MQCRHIDTIDQLDELFDLGVDHYDEVEPADVNYSVDRPKFYKLLEVGMLGCVGVYVEDVLVAYMLNIVTPSMFSDTVEAVNAAMYVSPSLRGQGVLNMMIDYSSEELKATGVDYMVVAFKPNTSGNVPQGFREMETFYKKRL